MAFLDGCDQVTFRDGLDIKPFLARALPVLPFGRLTVFLWQIGDNIGVPLQGAELVRAIEKLAGVARDDSDVRGPKLVSVAIAPSLLDGLGEFGVADSVTFALDCGIRALAL